jgi:hypothetical protein
VTSHPVGSGTGENARIVSETVTPGEELRHATSAKVPAAVVEMNHRRVYRSDPIPAGR